MRKTLLITIIMVSTMMVTIGCDNVNKVKNSTTKYEAKQELSKEKISVIGKVNNIEINKNPGNETILIDESEFDKIVDCINLLEISEINEKDFVGETTTIQIDTDKQSYNIAITEPYLVYNGKGYKIEDGTYDELKNIINELLCKVLILNRINNI